MIHYLSMYHIDGSFRKKVVTGNGRHAWQDEKGIITQDPFDVLMQHEN